MAIELWLFPGTSISFPGECICVYVCVLKKNKLSPISSALLKAEFMMDLLEKEAMRQDRTVLLLHFSC